MPFNDVNFTLNRLMLIWLTVLYIYSWGACTHSIRDHFKLLYFARWRLENNKLNWMPENFALVVFTVVSFNKSNRLSLTDFKITQAILFFFSQCMLVLLGFRFQHFKLLKNFLDIYNIIWIIAKLRYYECIGTRLYNWQC